MSGNQYVSDFSNGMRHILELKLEDLTPERVALEFEIARRIKEVFGDIAIFKPEEVNRFRQDLMNGKTVILTSNDTKP